MNRKSLTLLTFAAGFLTGIVYVAACGVSSSSSNAAGGTAADVAYDNARSGLAAANVQSALDEIGTTLESAVGGTAFAQAPSFSLLRAALAQTTGTTVWNGEIRTWDSANDALVTDTGFTVTFTETAPGEGTYVTTRSNILIKDDQGQAPMNGKYWIVDQRLIVSAGGASGFAWEITLADGGQTISFGDGTWVVRLTQAAGA